MRILVILCLALAAFFQLDAAGKKFPRLGEYKSVEIIRINHRGIQISHAEGMGYLNIENLNDEEKASLKNEIAQWEAQKKAYAANRKKAAAAKKIADRKAQAQKAALAKKQEDEIAKLLKSFAKMDIYKIVATLEKRFGIEKNRSLGLRGRCNSVIAYVRQEFPHARTQRRLIQVIDSKRVEREKASRLKAAQAKTQAAEISKFIKKHKDSDLNKVLGELEETLKITPEDKDDKDARIKAVVDGIRKHYALVPAKSRNELIAFVNSKNK